VQGEVTLPTYIYQPDPHAIRTMLNTAAAQTWQEKMTRNLNWQLSNKIPLESWLEPWLWSFHFF